MIDITIENYEKVQQALKDTPKIVNQVLSRAVNRAAKNAEVNMSKKVREQYVIKASDVKSAITIIKATSQSPVALVRATGKKNNLTKFKISPTGALQPQPKGGYKAKVKKSGSLNVVPRGFLVNVRGSLAFMQRVGSARMPIARLMGPSVPQMIGNKDVITYVENEAKSILDKRIQHELERVLGAKPK